MDASSSKTPFGLSHLSQGDEDDLNENCESRSQIINQNTLEHSTIERGPNAYAGANQSKYEKKQGSDPSPKQRSQKVIESELSNQSQN